MPMIFFPNQLSYQAISAIFLGRHCIHTIVATYILLSTNKNDMECKVVHLVEVHVGAHKLLGFIIGEG